MNYHETTEDVPERYSPTAKRFDARRLATAVLFIPLFYLLVRYLPAVAFFAIVLTAALLALFEFYRLCFRETPRRVDTSIGLGATGLLLINVQWPGLAPEGLLWFLSLLAVFTFALLSDRGLRETVADSAFVLCGILYITVTFGHLLLLRALDGGVFLIFFLILVTWGGDTGAFVVGKALGRRKLAPLISPNKTVEGLFGGLLFGTAMALLARAWFLPTFTIGDCLALGVVLAGLGAVGDLVESAFKRSAGVKDSGTLIPGHGGILDRVDSLLFAAPTFYYYVTLIKQ